MMPTARQRAGPRPGPPSPSSAPPLSIDSYLPGVYVALGSGDQAKLIYKRR